MDATGHVAGKLAAAVAKKLLEGYSITVVATENCIFTGPLYRHVETWYLVRLTEEDLPLQDLPHLKLFLSNLRVLKELCSQKHF
ncbi:unnamed protein product [Medioppia subpectinata]|uniref:Uncharacterized protein n=1 Tax=Medioppia subpectinata TaxID=1979941 RepID=A0A7R9PV28_9ACAR|nr:unnamed protein product [Medioppia subpectinata]CAG2102377.1 unnamed protein product [Medioppia subpectinata]